MSDPKPEHLRMIQDVIDRMGRNSFQLKGWTAVIVSAFLGFTEGTDEPDLVRVAAIPILVFWLLDAYYLGRERAFRALFDAVRTSSTDMQYSMDVSAHADKGSALKAAVSRTVAGFYGPLVVVVAVVWLVARG